MDLALNNLQRLVCHKTKSNQIPEDQCAFSARGGVPYKVFKRMSYSNRADQTTYKLHSDEITMVHKSRILIVNREIFIN